MLIDIHKKVIAKQLRRMIVILVYAISVLLIILMGKPEKFIFGLNNHHWAIVLTIIFALFLVIESLFNYNYIYFSDQKEKIVLRYFSLGYFNRRKNSIEIPISEFVNYEVVSTFFGIQPKIILYRKVKDTEAKYPAVCLSLLSKSEIQKLKNCLNTYIQK